LTKIDWNENTSDFTNWLVVKTFVVARSRDFRMIRLRQTGTNPEGRHYLALNTLELFDAVSWLQ
jgi:hypothetical protein